MKKKLTICKNLEDRLLWHSPMCFFRMPVQYVIEEWDFRDLTLKTKPPVVIPRPETEVKNFSELDSTCPNFATNWQWTSNGGDFLDKHGLCVWKHLFPFGPAGLCVCRSWLVWFSRTSGWCRRTHTTDLRCLEVGCGSGAISLSLLHSIPQVCTQCFF